jgi:hypothetical protein
MKPMRANRADPPEVGISWLGAGLDRVAQALHGEFDIG